MIIYQAVNLVNNHMYIGQTNGTLQRRKRLHELRAINGESHTVKFHNALRKYGIENFQWYILHECTSKEEMDEMEVFFIEKFNTFHSEEHYNMTPGGQTGGMHGKKHSEETKRKMSEWQRGVAKKKEHCEKISETLRGRKLPKSTVEKLKHVHSSRSDEEKERLCTVKKKVANKLYEQIPELKELRSVQMQLRYCKDEGRRTSLQEKYDNLKIIIQRKRQETPVHL